METLSVKAGSRRDLHYNGVFPLKPFNVSCFDIFFLYAVLLASPQHEQINYNLSKMNSLKKKKKEERKQQDSVSAGNEVQRLCM